MHYMSLMNLDAWKSQLRKGAAELAVLAVLERNEDYGIAILQKIEAGEGLGVSEGSLYPLLKRLEGANRIASKWVDAGDGTAPRKYYALTKDGRAALKDMREYWYAFQDQMTQVVEG